VRELTELLLARIDVNRSVNAVVEVRAEALGGGSRPAAATALTPRRLPGIAR